MKICYILFYTIYIILTNTPPELSEIKGEETQRTNIYSKFCGILRYKADTRIEFCTKVNMLTQSFTGPNLT